MRLLLDTHVAVWTLIGAARLDRPTLDMIADRHNSVHVSVVSIWEIAIKRGLGRKGAPAISVGAAIEGFGLLGYAILDITAAHAAAAEHLPPVHADPFDRLLVAQALTEPMRLLTRDALLSKYSPTIVQV